MNKQGFVIKATKQFGEKRDYPTRYDSVPGMGGVRLRDWERDLVEDAFDAGKKHGRTEERRRLLKRAEKVTFGMRGSQRGAILDIFDK